MSFLNRLKLASGWFWFDIFFVILNLLLFVVSRHGFSFFVAMVMVFAAAMRWQLDNQSLRSKGLL